MQENFNQNMDMLVDGAANRTNRIKQGIAETRYHVEEQMGSLSKFARITIGRAYYFRDDDKKTENYKNHFLSVARNAFELPKPSESKELKEYDTTNSGSTG